MTAALITLGLGVATVASAMLVMFIDNRDAERRCGDARENGQLLAGKLAIASADVTTWKYKALSEEKRANALDDLIAKHAGGDAGPVAGSLDRLLEEWRSARKVAATAGSDGAGAVPPQPAPEPAGPVAELAKPGDI